MRMLGRKKKKLSNIKKRRQVSKQKSKEHRGVVAMGDKDFRENKKG